MNERKFIVDLWDLLCGNDDNITQEEFKEKYDDFLVQCDTDGIEISDGEGNEWRLNLTKVN